MDAIKTDVFFDKNTVEKDDVKVYDVRESPFDLYGFYMPESGEVFRRIPNEVAKNTSKSVEELNVCTTGGRVRFKTDSKYIALKMTTKKAGIMKHMSASGSMGFDLYANGHFVKNYMPEPDYSEPGKVIFHVEGGYEGIIKFSERKMRDIIINFPVHCSVSDVFIGVEKSALVEGGNKYKYNKPVVYYGSSITQGECVSRPGNTYEAIISRKLDCDFLNLGFSGNAKAEDAIAEYISGLDMSVFVYDYDHNAPNVEHLKNTHKAMFDKIRAKNPDLPIIMVTRPNRSLSTIPEVSRDIEINARIDVVYNTYKQAIDAGDKNVYFINGQDIFNHIDSDVMTCDGCHPNDFGMWCMAEVIGDVVKKVIK